MKKQLRDELLQVFPYGSTDCDIQDLESIFRMISRSPGPYGDMGPRNLKGSGRQEVQEKKLTILHELAQKLQTQIHKPAKSQEEFDAWHEKTCVWLAGELQMLCSAGVTVKPGKAQKLINMSMKHLFCCPSAEKIALNDAFKFCHMPIDRYVLSWYYREVCGEGFVPFDSPKMNWGGMKYDEYLHIQKNIRTYLSCKERNMDYYDQNGHALTALETEFYVWNEESLIIAADAFQNQLKNNQNTRWMKCGTMRKQFDEIYCILTNESGKWKK